MKLQITSCLLSESLYGCDCHSMMKNLYFSYSNTTTTPVYHGIITKTIRLDTTNKKVYITWTIQLIHFVPGAVEKIAV